MPLPSLPSSVTSSAVPLAVAIGGAFLARRLLGPVISVVAMLAVGRLLLTALKIDLALAERRARVPRPKVAERGGSGSSGR